MRHLVKQTETNTVDLGVGRAAISEDQCHLIQVHLPTPCGKIMAVLGVLAARDDVLLYPFPPESYPELLASLEMCSAQNQRHNTFQALVPPVPENIYYYC